MNNNTMITDLLNVYYEGLNGGKDWVFVLSDDFRFLEGDMTKTDPLVGSNSYVEVIKRFSKLFTSVRIKEMIVEGNKAFVLANYDFVFPGGKRINGDVAEIWEIKEGKLDMLTIFFDTDSFRKFLTA